MHVRKVLYISPAYTPNDINILAKASFKYIFVLKHVIISAQKKFLLPSIDVNKSY